VIECLSRKFKPQYHQKKKEDSLQKRSMCEAVFLEVDDEAGNKDMQSALTSCGLHCSEGHF
jgi:hypothetical protein